MYTCKYFHAIQKLQKVFSLLGRVHWEVLGILETSPILVLSFMEGVICYILKVQCAILLTDIGLFSVHILGLAVQIATCSVIFVCPYFFVYSLGHNF